MTPRARSLTLLLEDLKTMAPVQLLDSVVVAPYARVRWMWAVLIASGVFSQGAAPVPDYWEGERTYLLQTAEAVSIDEACGALVRTTVERLQLAKSARVSPESDVVAQKLSLRTFRSAATYAYDPVALTVAAGLETRAYDRGGKEEWQTLPLPLAPEDADSRFYKKDVPAHVRLGDPANKHLFIVFNSSFSTWERGSWINKGIALLRQEFGEAHFVVFAGFLAPEFLDLQATVPPLGGAMCARDILPRIRLQLMRWAADGKIPGDSEAGVIGFSGGANLAIPLLAEDGRPSDRGGKKPFLKRGIAFSPILDLSCSFDLLDDSTQLLTERGFAPTQALTSPWKDNTLYAALRGANPFEATPYLQITARLAENEPKRQELRAHFYREFEVEDLAVVMTAPYAGMERLRKGSPPFSYNAWYRGTVFPEHQRRFKLDPHLTFEQYTSIEPELAAVRAPLYLVFSQDDPVLSRSAFESVKDSSERCRAVLRQAERMSALRVFAPSYGAHLGYILDNEFLKSTFRASFH